MPYRALINGLFGRRINRQHDNYLIEKYKSIEEDPVFFNESNSLYLKRKELNGYVYLSLKLVSRTNVHTNKPIELHFLGENVEYKVHSDLEQVEGDYSELSRIGITTFDIDCTPELEEFLKKSTLTGLDLHVPNNKLVATPHTIHFNQVNTTVLLESLAF